MFVSSYSTYITPASTHSNKSKKQDEGRYLPPSSLNEKASPQEQATQKKLPINFISDYKVLSNQQKLQNQTKEFEKNTFSKVNKLNNAKVAYQENITRFSFTKKPQIALNKEINRLPQPTTAKLNAVNIYLQNDNYYKVTA